MIIQVSPQLLFHYCIINDQIGSVTVKMRPEHIKHQGEPCTRQERYRNIIAPEHTHMRTLWIDGGVRTLFCCASSGSDYNCFGGKKIQRCLAQSNIAMRNVSTRPERACVYIKVQQTARCASQHKWLGGFWK